MNAMTLALDTFVSTGIDNEDALATYVTLVDCNHPNATDVFRTFVQADDDTQNQLVRFAIKQHNILTGTYRMNAEGFMKFKRAVRAQVDLYKERNA